MSRVHVLATSALHASSPLAGAILAATSKAKTSTLNSSLIFFVLLFVVGYFFLIRPRQRQRQRQVQVSKQISVGDKVMLSSGIIGTVEGFVGDRARIEVAPGIVIEVVRQAVAQRINDVVDDDGSYDDSHNEHDHDDHDDPDDDASHDPYSVAPLEENEKGGTTDAHDDGDQSHSSGNGSGGGST